MVQLVTIGLVSLTVLVAAGVGRAVQSAGEETRYGVCKDFAGRNLAKAAQRTLESASRELNAARNGGSLYVAAKVGGAPDPAEVALAQARLDQALRIRHAAFAACAH
ncbi:MAG: hypothetical protein JWM33_983 [Caulobacteraceae bacterium]|nr:hypothetical protein [Caulobacteraceae bacterium]